VVGELGNRRERPVPVVGERHSIVGRPRAVTDGSMAAMTYVLWQAIAKEQADSAAVVSTSPVMSV
jgi:hypothetical protein